MYCKAKFNIITLTFFHICHAPINVLADVNCDGQENICLPLEGISTYECSKPIADQQSAESSKFHVVDDQDYSKLDHTNLENMMAIEGQLNYGEISSQLSNLNVNQQPLDAQCVNDFNQSYIEEPNEAALKREHEAMEIVIKARDTIRDSEKLGRFFQIIQANQATPIKAFELLHNLCQGIPDLQEVLLDLLTPEQALELNPIVYAQHCLRNDMKEFCQKIKSYYATNHSNQAGQTQAIKVFKELHNFISQDHEKITSEELRSFATRLFKGNQQLIDEFIAFLPEHTEERARLWQNLDPEIIDLSDEENEFVAGSSQKELDSLQGYEHIKNIPETEEEKLFGTEKCTCLCHPKNRLVTSHCIHCSIRFINGKIYARDGKVLKPVKVNYPNGQNPFMNNDNSLANTIAGN